MRKWLFLLFLGLFAFSVIRTVSNPLRKSDSDLRGWLLHRTPLGSSSDEVRSALQARGWYTDGYATTEPRPADDPFVAGELGGYQDLPWYVHVAAFWEFDDKDQLRDIKIRRIIDSP